MRKKLTAVLLAATMLLTSGVTVFADRVDAVIDKPYLALGADLSPQEQMTVLSLLGLSDINVDDYDIISITNADEHEYLDKYLDASIIGTRALSSVLVVGKEAGNGIHVTTKNISYCTEGMYRNALLTAGIEDADITVAGPFSISGTAALVGAIKAYETMTGEEIDDENLDAANDELVLTGKLVEDIGDSEKAEDLMALVKQEVAENKLTSAEDIQNVVDQACDQLDIQLSEENQKQIAELMKKIEGLDLDVDKLKDQAKDLYQKLEDLDFHVDKESVGNFFTRIIDAIVNFFQGLFVFFHKPLYASSRSWVAQHVGRFEQRLNMEIGNRHYPATTAETAAHQLYGFVTALKELGMVREHEYPITLDHFTKRPNSQPDQANS